MGLDNHIRKRAATIVVIIKVTKNQKSALVKRCLALVLSPLCLAEESVSMARATLLLGG